MKQTENLCNTCHQTGGFAIECPNCSSVDIGPVKREFGETVDIQPKIESDIEGVSCHYEKTEEGVSWLIMENGDGNKAPVAIVALEHGTDKAVRLLVPIGENGELPCDFVGFNPDQPALRLSEVIWLHYLENHPGTSTLKVPSTKEILMSMKNEMKKSEQLRIDKQMPYSPGVITYNKEHKGFSGLINIPIREGGAKVKVSSLGSL
jgi:hypothetical protein